MGYISNNNLINCLPLSTTQPHLLLTQYDSNGNDHHHHQLTTGSSGELDDRKNNLPTAGPSRWNPTPEQIAMLEEVYRRGTRTPTTEQIQEIASKLRKYGRIEGKNVFFWFQNHKARERLKRRRGDINNVRETLKDVKDSSSGGYGVDQTKSCPSFPHTNPQPQKELVRENYNKDAMWRSLVTSIITQEPGETNIDENGYNVNGEVEEEEEEEEETREIRTLNLFPVKENQDKADRFTEKKKNTNANSMCYYYEFMPLKKN